MSIEQRLDRQEQEFSANADIINSLNDDAPRGERECTCTEAEHDAWCTKNLPTEGRYFPDFDGQSDEWVAENRTARAARVSSPASSHMPATTERSTNIVPLPNKTASADQPQTPETRQQEAA